MLTISALYFNSGCIFYTDLEHRKTHVTFYFYRVELESFICRGITARCGNLTVQLRSLISCLVQTSPKIIEAKNHPSLWTFCEQSVIRQARKITSDLSHILHSELQLLASGRRHRVPKSRLNCYKYLCPSPSDSSTPTHSRRGDPLVQYHCATFLL